MVRRPMAAGLRPAGRSADPPAARHRERRRRRSDEQGDRAAGRRLGGHR